MECSVDETWGTRSTINDERALDKERWVNQGILGEILEEIRNDYRLAEDSTVQENIADMEEKAAVN